MYTIFSVSYFISTLTNFKTFCNVHETMKRRRHPEAILEPSAKQIHLKGRRMILSPALFFHTIIRTLTIYTRHTNRFEAISLILSKLPPLYVLDIPHEKGQQHKCNHFPGCHSRWCYICVLWLKLIRESIYTYQYEPGTHISPIKLVHFVVLMP